MIGGFSRRAALKAEKQRTNYGQLTLLTQANLQDKYMHTYWLL
jgi:hypothetical protein